MTIHRCTIVDDRYPSCSCGSGTWPCRRERQEEATAKQRADDQRLARAVVDEQERRGRRR